MNIDLDCNQKVTSDSDSSYTIGSEDSFTTYDNDSIWADEQGNYVSKCEFHESNQICDDCEVKWLSYINWDEEHNQKQFIDDVEHSSQLTDSYFE